MKKKQLETVIYSAAGVVVMLLILVAVNFIASFVKVRADLTAEKAYTLSEGTRAILSSLDTPVKLRLYVTQSENSMPMPLRTYARRIEDLLNEYRHVSRGMIEIERLDPQPDSAAEDSARLDGVQGQMVQGGVPVYLGLSAELLDARAAIPFFHPARERSLEYDISRVIAEVTRTEKAVIGVMSSLDVFGQPSNPMMARMGQRPTPSWVLISELQRDFEVRQLDGSVEAIDPEIGVLLVIHPRNISPGTQFALDQFVLRGGRLIAFLDPLCILDRSGGNPMQGGTISSSNLDLLLKAWGVEYDPSRVLADVKYSSQTPQGPMPLVLDLTSEAINRDDLVASQIDNLLMAFAGVFRGTPAEGLRKTVLVNSSRSSQLADAFLAQIAAEQVLKEFRAGDEEHALAIRLDGRFRTAFPEGRPGGAADQEPGAAADAAYLRESRSEGVVILFGDADMIHDQASVQEYPVLFGGGGRVVSHRNGNLPLVQGLTDLLGGDQRLIAMRSRASINRPFTVINEMRAQAEERYRGKIQSLEQDLADTQRRLNELQQGRDDGQRFILSPEQQAELNKFRQRETDVQRELRAERNRLREDIMTLEKRAKMLNVGGMPLVVALSGILLAIVKRKRTAAK